jgi:hypothetical protein
MALLLTPPAPKVHLLIDGDTIAFIAAAAVQTNFEDEWGNVSPRASILEGTTVIDNMLFNIGRGLGATERESWTIPLSDPSGANWRFEVEPTYKQNRKAQSRPLILNHLKQYLREAYRAFHWVDLEADDVIGILMTDPLFHNDVMDTLIAVGRDKDFNTIPGLHHTIGDMEGTKLRVRGVSAKDAQDFFLAQVLAGDRVDGFPGCPGVGMARAKAIVASPVRLKPSKGVITRGKNKGQEVTKWVAEPTGDVWEAIVTHYEKAGLGEAEALKTARLARILRHGEHALASADDDTVVELWEPSKIERFDTP